MSPTNVVTHTVQLHKRGIDWFFFILYQKHHLCNHSTWSPVEANYKIITKKQQLCPLLLGVKDPSLTFTRSTQDSPWWNKNKLQLKQHSLSWSITLTFSQQTRAASFQREYSYKGRRELERARLLRSCLWTGWKLIRRRVVSKQLFWRILSLWLLWISKKFPNVKALKKS